MDLYIKFKLSGRFAHFLKAEGGASCPSYKVPPRTVLIGLIGAILGFEKDQPQVLLADSKLAVEGNAKQTFWHMGNYRKDPPAPLPTTIKKGQKGTSAEGRNTRLNQEWLIEPQYTVWAVLPNTYHTLLENRLHNKKWHFSPYLGLSEHFANVSQPIETGKTFALPNGKYQVKGIIRRKEAQIDLSAALNKSLIIHPIMMPRSVSSLRQFEHETYFWEPNSTPLPVQTNAAWKVGSDIVMWL